MFRSDVFRGKSVKFRVSFWRRMPDFAEISVQKRFTARSLFVLIRITVNNLSIRSFSVNWQLWKEKTDNFQRDSGQKKSLRF